MQLNKIGRPLFSNVFARVFGVDELDAVSTLAPEVMPTTSPWERPEFWALLGGSLCGGRASMAAVVGQNSAVGIGNPAGSGVLTILERVILRSAVACTFGVRGFDEGIFNVLVAPIHRDTRRASSSGGPFNAGIGTRIRQGSNAGDMVGGNVLFVATGPLDIPLEMVLAEATMLAISPGTLNVAVEAAFIFRERAAMPDELDRI